MEQRKRKIKRCIIITKNSSLIGLFISRTQKGWVLKHRQSTIKYDTKFKQTGNVQGNKEIAYGRFRLLSKSRPMQLSILLIRCS